MSESSFNIDISTPLLTKKDCYSRFLSGLESYYIISFAFANILCLISIFVPWFVIGKSYFFLLVPSANDFFEVHKN